LSQYCAKLLPPSASMQSFPMPSCRANAAIGSSKTDDLNASISFIENRPVRRSVSLTIP
jgi:hypothetical protein